MSTYYIAIVFNSKLHLECALNQSFSTFFRWRPTFCQKFALGPTFTEPLLQNSRVHITEVSKITKKTKIICYLFLMQNLSLPIGYDKIDSRLDRRQSHAQSSIQSIGFKTVSSLDFVTVEKPDSQRYMVANDEKNPIAPSVNEEYCLNPE